MLNPIPHDKKNGEARQVYEELVGDDLAGFAPDGTPIPKPAAVPDMNQFKSKRGARAKEIETLQSALPMLKIGNAADLVRLHPDEENYWSDGSVQRMGGSCRVG